MKLQSMLLLTHHIFNKPFHLAA